MKKKKNDEDIMIEFGQSSIIDDSSNLVSSDNDDNCEIEQELDFKMINKTKQVTIFEN